MYAICVQLKYFVCIVIFTTFVTCSVRTVHALHSPRGVAYCFYALLCAVILFFSYVRRKVNIKIKFWLHIKSFGRFRFN